MTFPQEAIDKKKNYSDPLTCRMWSNPMEYKRVPSIEENRNLYNTQCPETYTGIFFGGGDLKNAKVMNNLKNITSDGLNRNIPDVAIGWTRNSPSRISRIKTINNQARYEFPRSYFY